MNLAAFNDDWLAAWSDKDVTRLLGFYTDDAIYIDPQVPNGVSGRTALGDYLATLFAATPSMNFLADRIWPSSDGYFGRWYCEIGGEARRLRGLDVVTLREHKISFNEVYTHTLVSPA